ncbi:MAG: hypothetical protein Q4G59_03850 [Planctomycetia bacterium]|nr:hypothetical protein [Planctomycetia bacterium]
MVIEKPVPAFLDWIGPALLNWLVAVGSLLVLFAIVGFIFMLIRTGPGQVFSAFSKNIIKGFEDLADTSWRRVFAIAGLIIRESIRKKVIVVCVIFLLLLMFASWFLDPKSTDPARLYLSFVLSVTNYLVLLLALFLSALSLPSDFKNKTIFTIVTKPVRASEIVLGRIVGLAVIGTGILLLMALVSYLFVSSSLSHTHIVIDGEDISPVVRTEKAGQAADSTTVIAKGETRLQNWHKHEIEEYADGTFNVAQVNNHTHPIRKVVEGDNVRYIVGAERGTVQAKVPIYGKMKFRDANEFEKTRGINVGEEWEYRSYVAGASPEAVIWTFDHVTPQQFPNGLPVEMTISVFRTHKGNIEQTIMGSLLIRNPETGLTAETNIFNSEKYVTNALLIPRKIDRGKVEEKPRLLKQLGAKETFERSDKTAPEKESYDLFEDFVVNGKVEIWLQCIDNGQYFGAAEPDLYIRATDANVLANFLKGYLGIWQQMLILISFGVLFSTFLSGPVAMVSTFGIMIAAFCKQLFLQVAYMQALGGGPFEAFKRLVSHENLMTELPKDFSSSLLKFFDWIASGCMSVIGLAVPSFSDYNIYMDSVAAGYDIPLNTMLVHGVTTLAYVVPLFIVGYLILRNREVAK